jgi:predicted phosphodiesterase
LLIAQELGVLFAKTLSAGIVMRVAIVSDIHGNRTALEAVLGDLRRTAPDLIFHGGDLAHGGASPLEVVDRIRDLGWPGVVGNTDELLFDPGSLTDFAKQSPKLQLLFAAIEEMAEATRSALGEERLTWMRALPRRQIHNPIALVHASPESTWRAPAPEASDAELWSVYGSLGQPIAVYGHIHLSYVRRVPVASGTTAPGTPMPELTVANSGSVSLSHDGDRRAAYLLVEGSSPTIRRVEYDVDKELAALSVCGLPHADWMAKILESGRPQMP